MIEWINGNVMSQIVTFNSNNLTLNQNAIQHFEDVRFVTVGINHQDKTIVIHPVSKQELDIGLFNPEQLHKISIGNGYGKISNKQMCEQISRYFDLKFDGQKYYASFNTRDKLLVIDLSNPVQLEVTYG